MAHRGACVSDYAALLLTFVVAARPLELDIRFEDPVLLGPASTPNGTICACNFVPAPDGKGVVCARTGTPPHPWMPKRVYSDCDAGAQYVYP